MASARLTLLSSCRRRCVIAAQLLIGGIEPNPGPRSSSVQPSRTLKVSAMLMDVDEYEGRVLKAKHTVTYVDRDSPFIEDRLPAQWSYKVRTTPKLKSPMHKFAVLLDKYEEAVTVGDRCAARTHASQGKAWAENYPNSVFAQMASIADWKRMQSAVHDLDTALEWCDYLRDNCEQHRRQMGLPSLEANATYTAAEYEALQQECADLSAALTTARTEHDNVKRWWLSEKVRSRSLEDALKDVRTELVVLLALGPDSADLTTSTHVSTQTELNVTPLQQTANAKAAIASTAPMTPSVASETATPAPALPTSESAEMQRLRKHLSEAHESLFAQEAQLGSVHAELEHVRDELRDTQARLREERTKSRAAAKARAPVPSWMGTMMSTITDTQTAATPAATGPFAQLFAGPWTATPLASTRLSSPKPIESDGALVPKKATVRRY